MALDPDLHAALVVGAARFFGPRGSDVVARLRRRWAGRPDAHRWCLVLAARRAWARPATARSVERGGPAAWAALVPVAAVLAGCPQETPEAFGASRRPELWAVSVPPEGAWEFRLLEEA